MASTDLLIRVLADTSSAQNNVNQLVSVLGKTAGIAAGAGVVAETLQLATSYQTAMAKIQVAYNSADFAPGTAKYKDAHDSIISMTEKLGTPFAEMATTWSQGARFMDEFGNRLPTAKVHEYSESMARLALISSDNLSADELGRYAETFAKLTDSTNFAGVANAVSALSGVHNLGEGPMLQGAIGLAQSAGGLGLSQADLLATSNFLVDRGAAAGMAGGAGAMGSSIGRMLMRMDASVDDILDPDQTYKQERKERDASERVTDLQNELQVAEQRRQEMNGKHGQLLRNYRKHPSEVTAADDHIAKLQREVLDAQDDLSHVNDPKAAGAGHMNMAAMAAVAGKDADAFANLFLSNPEEPLIEFAEALHNMPANERSKALRDAGITNVRDVKTMEQLISAPEALRAQHEMAQSRLDATKFLNPSTGSYESLTDVQGADTLQRSGTILDTTAKKEDIVKIKAQNAGADIGEGERTVLDASLDKLIAALNTDSTAVKTVSDALTSTTFASIVTTGIVAALASAIPAIITGVLVGKTAAGVAGAAGGSAAAGAAGAVAGAGAGAAVPAVLAGSNAVAGLGAVGALIGVGSTVGAALGISELGKQLAVGVRPFQDQAGAFIHDNIPLTSQIGDWLHEQGSQPMSPIPIVNIGDVHIQLDPQNGTGSDALGAKAEEIKAQVVQIFSQALAQVTGSGDQQSQVSPQLGGAR